MKRNTIKPAKTTRVAVAGILAAALALAPLPSFAADEAPSAGPAPESVVAAAPFALQNADDVEVPMVTEGAVPTEDAMPLAPAESEGEGRPNAANDAEDTTLTVHYREIVSYDDPSFDDPSGLRLLETRTFNVKVGQEIDPWSYVILIPDFFFWDGRFDSTIMDADPSKNVLDLDYFRSRSSSMVNYYVVTDGVAESDAERTVVTNIDGAPVRFDKLGSYEIESQKLGTLIPSEVLAVPLEELVYLDADRESIKVEPLASENEINLFYTPAATTLPDKVPAGDAPELEAPAPGDGNDPDAGAGEGEADVETGTGSTDGPTNDQISEDETVPETTIVDDGAPLASAEEAGVLPLPQTGDEVMGIALLASAALAAGGVTLVARRRQ